MDMIAKATPAMKVPSPTILTTGTPPTFFLATAIELLNKSLLLNGKSIAATPTIATFTQSDAITYRRSDVKVVQNDPARNTTPTTHIRRME